MKDFLCTASCLLESPRSCHSPPPSTPPCCSPRLCELIYVQSLTFIMDTTSLCEVFSDLLRWPVLSLCLQTLSKGELMHLSYGISFCIGCGICDIVKILMQPTCHLEILVCMTLYLANTQLVSKFYELNCEKRKNKTKLKYPATSSVLLILRETVKNKTGT